MSQEVNKLDRFVHGRAAQFAAFAWGFAEATLFFVVPDVLLTLVGCRSIRAGLKGCGAAVLGALLGGFIMYGAGRAAPESSRSLLSHVPGIHSELITRVESQLATHGLSALLIGPALGIPYKIYAVEWGAYRGNVATFLLTSLPARGIRFVLSVLVANGIASLLKPWTRRGLKMEMTILALFWITFYTFYFSHFGW